MIGEHGEHIATDVLYGTKCAVDSQLQRIVKQHQLDADVSRKPHGLDDALRDLNGLDWRESCRSEAS